MYVYPRKNRALMRKFSFKNSCGYSRFVGKKGTLFLLDLAFVLVRFLELTSRVLFFSQEMAPKKLFTKRSRRDTTGEGSRAASEFDSHRFRSAEHQQHFEAIRGWSFHRDRHVQLREDEYSDFQEEIAHRHWTPLVTPMAKFDPEIVLEFYANAWPTEEGVRDMRSWVRG